MNKIVFIFFFVSVHASICMAQITSKTVYDKDYSSLKLTIFNLHEDTSVVLKSDNAQAREVELLQSFSNRQVRSYINKNKLIDIRLLFYDKSDNERKDVTIRISDKKLQETVIAPLDSVTYTIFCLDAEERTTIRKVGVRVNIPYSIVGEKILEGHYRRFEDIYLPIFEE